MQTLNEFLNNHYINNVDMLEEQINIIESKSKKDKDFFFKNIIFFTNERDPNKNKTLNNILDAIKDTNIELFVFVSNEISYKAEDTFITISDSKNSYTIKDQSNTDTIVIVRLGAQDDMECMEVIKELQNWGLFVINPINKGIIASNKYYSAVLMERYNIPQPRYTLLSKNDILEGMDSLIKRLELIYPNLQTMTKEKQQECEYVIKLLSGHGGCGVFLCNGATILGILQAMFALDENLQLLLQKKEEIDGGDIRVHVLTSRTNQKILASMKRVKLGNDFRSNVSLGATVEPITLTKEQEEIALKVAKISGMPWCAVDIAPLVKGSNKEIGDNIVLEYNASPGTQGISEAIKENFMAILLESINDINELVLTTKDIGYIENLLLQFDENSKYLELEAKLDTGNGSKASTLGVEKIEESGEDIIATLNSKKYIFKRYGTSTVNVGPTTEKRITVILPEIKLGTRKLKNVEFALVDNRNKSTKVLLNRDVLSKMGYVINPAKKHTLDDIVKLYI